MDNDTFKGSRWKAWAVDAFVVSLTVFMLVAATLLAASTAGLYLPGDKFDYKVEVEGHLYKKAGITLTHDWACAHPSHK